MTGGIMFVIFGGLIAALTLNGEAPETLDNIIDALKGIKK